MAPITPASWMAVALVLLPLVASLEAPFNVYGSCPSGEGMCRQRSPATGLSSAGRGPTAAAGQQDPLQKITMRFPCTEASTCKENLDVVRPVLPPTGLNVTRCSTTLMPWSPFPCSFDSSKFNGSNGQPTDLCYNTGSSRESPFEGFDLARSLTTDRYKNLFSGVMPSRLSQPGCSNVRLQDARRLVLAVDFRVAAGSQFDRTYWFTIGDAVAAFGATSLPATDAALTLDKTWSVNFDITHLQPYLRPNQPTRFALANGFDMGARTNVPFWATVRLHAYYETQQAPSSFQADPTETPDVTVQKAEGPMDWQQQLERLEEELLRSPTGSRVQDLNNITAADSAVKAADVPDEVLPLLVRERSGLAGAADGMNIVNANINNTGGNASVRAWPSVTFLLPASLSSASNIYRAQLLLTPKPEGCEEFWAASPANSSCSQQDGQQQQQQQLGEPYRELRVFLDGQLAGFSPIAYTTPLAGMSPLLWDAIAPAYTHQLPSYTFDISPWLGRLNSADRNHSIAVAIAHQTTSSWKVAATLLLWRADVPVTVVQPPRVLLSPNMQQPVQSRCSNEQNDAVRDCQLVLQTREMAATALLKVGDVELIAAVRYSLLTFNSSAQTNTTQFEMADGRVATTSSWRVNSSFEAAWFLGGRQGNATALRELLSPSPGRVPGILTQNFRRYNWLNSGVNLPKDVEGAAFESSFNETLVVPALHRAFSSSSSSSSSGSSSSTSVVPVVARGQQRHYQLALNLGFDAAKACAEPRLSHIVSLNSSIGAGSSRGQQEGSAAGCVAWKASAAYCSPQLIVNELSTNAPCAV